VSCAATAMTTRIARVRVGATGSLYQIAVRAAALLRTSAVQGS
jgi:hypothetical protein